MSRYANAADVLPPDLLAAVQRYAAGQQLYIPGPPERAPWGERTGTRRMLAERNAEIRRRYLAGEEMDQLAAAFCLSPDTVRKAVRGARRAAVST